MPNWPLALIHKALIAIIFDFLAQAFFFNGAEGRRLTESQ